MLPTLWMDEFNRRESASLLRMGDFIAVCNIRSPYSAIWSSSVINGEIDTLIVYVMLSILGQMAAIGNSNLQALSSFQNGWLQLY